MNEIRNLKQTRFGHLECFCNLKLEIGKPAQS